MHERVDGDPQQTKCREYRDTHTIKYMCHDAGDDNARSITECWWVFGWQTAQRIRRYCSGQTGHGKLALLVCGGIM